MPLLKLYATTVAILWGGIVVLGLLGRRRGAAVWSGLTAVAASVPFLPRCGHYLLDQEGFVARYGEAAIHEAVVSGVCAALALAALIAMPLAARYAWGWVLPAAAVLPPAALLVWLAFWFRLFF